MLRPVVYPVQYASINLGVAGDNGSPPPTATTVTIDAGNMKPLASRAPEPGCTTTLQYNFNPACSWDGTSTKYPSTTTATKRINCNGCANLDLGWGSCPLMVVNDFKTAKTPFTETVTVCDTATLKLNVAAAIVTADIQRRALNVASPQTSAGILLRPRETGKPNLEKREDLAACPTTYVAVPEQQAGKTATSYAKFTTTTVKLNCGGCPLVVTTLPMAYGPPSVFDKTTTLPTGAKTTYACS